MTRVSRLSGSSRAPAGNAPSSSPDAGSASDDPARSLKRAKTEAQAAVARAIRAGALPAASSQPCRCCGESATKHHHWSYLPEHQLDVAPVCNGCHAQIHAGRIPDPTSGAFWDGAREPRRETPRSRECRALYGDTLRRLRVEREMTQSQAGKLAGMTGAGWQAIESGHNGASEDVLRRMFEALGYTMTLSLAPEPVSA